MTAASSWGFAKSQERAAVVEEDDGQAEAEALAYGYPTLARVRVAAAWQEERLSSMEVATADGERKYRRAVPSEQRDSVVYRRVEG